MLVFLLSLVSGCRTVMFQLLASTVIVSSLTMRAPTGDACLSSPRGPEASMPVFGR